MQQNKAKARSMAQMLELTKRYYVTQKAKQIKNKLEDLSRKQQQLSKESLDQNTPAKQSEINKKFQDLKEMLETLRAKNQALSKPINLPDTQKEETAVQEDQAAAKTQLQQKELSQDTDQQTKLNSKASKSQQKAAKKNVSNSRTNRAENGWRRPAANARRLSNVAPNIRQSSPFFF